jgi:hypothetical protein
MSDVPLLTDRFSILKLFIPCNLFIYDQLNAQVTNLFRSMIF